MDTSPLVSDEIDAGSAFLNELNRHRRVVAACWLRREETEERYLYAAIEGLTSENSDLAYGEVLRISNSMKTGFIDSFRVKLIGESHPIARELAEIYKRHPNHVPTRVDGGAFAGGGLEEIYIYPPV
jgi:hypothetical protein